MHQDSFRRLGTDRFKELRELERKLNDFPDLIELLLQPSDISVSDLLQVVPESIA